MEWPIIDPALYIAFDETSSNWSVQKAPNFSAFHWSPNGSLVSIGQHFMTTRVVHLPKRTNTSLITESDQSGSSHRIVPGCDGRAKLQQLVIPIISVFRVMLISLPEFNLICSKHMICKT